MIQRVISGSASWMITPSPTRPATPSARGPYPATYIGISGSVRAHSSLSVRPFQVTSRPFIRSLIISSAASNSATGTGSSPTTRREESPRPIPITIRPSLISCRVA